MKTGFPAVVLFLPLVLHGLDAAAQGVYVSPGEKGPVFSDRPRSGAREVKLEPLTVVRPPREPANISRPVAGNAQAAPEMEGERPRSGPAADAYARFSIVEPKNDGSVVANTAVFEVRVAVDPPLRLDEGHAFVVGINGVAVGQRFTATEFMIPPEFWGDSLPPPNQKVRLDASVVDAKGVVLTMAAPVHFYLRHAWMRHPGPQHPPPLPAPKPLPRLDIRAGAPFGRLPEK